MANYLDALNSVKDIGAIRNIGIEFAGSIGCDFFVYTGVGQMPISSPELTIIGNYPERWMARYEAKEYFRIDPTVRHAAHSVVPLYWCDLEIDDRQVLDFFRDAACHGVVSGVTVPLHSGGGYSGILSLVSQRDEPSVYEALKSEASNILFFGYTMHKIVMERLNVVRQLDEGQLTDMEKKCLLWAAEGKTAWAIAEIMSIKERTVVFHLNRAAKKLGAANRQHAIACAVALGEVRPIVATIPDKLNFRQDA